MKWAITLEAVDVDTGELLNGNAKEIRKTYKILRQKRTTKYINTEFGRIHLEWECMRKPEQLKLRI